MIVVMIAAIGAVGAFYGYRYAGQTGALIGAAAGAAAGLVAGLVIKLITGSVGGSAGSTLFSGRTPNWSRREQLGADVSQARHHKKNGRFEEALRKVNSLLDEDPDFPEVLILKAEIMWEGYENLESAKRYLRKVLAQTPEGDSHHDAASTFYKELVRIEKIQNMSSEPREPEP